VGTYCNGIIDVLILFTYLCRMNLDLTQYTIEELVELKNEIDNHVHSYEDGFVYICKVRSYGRSWNERVSNPYTLQELCYRYDGYDGIVDVYSTNSNLSIENYGDVKYIVSESDYDKWKGYEDIKNTIPSIIEELDEWDNRDNVPFNQRPMFSPVYTREDLVEYEKKLTDYDMSFVAPASYNREL